MKIGRNDPCPCGSGKKYKKCCLAKDEAATRQASADAAAEVAAARQASVEAAAQRMAQSLPQLPQYFDPTYDPLPELPELPELPLLASARHEDDALWEEFEAAEPPEQLAIFQRTLDRPDIGADDLDDGASNLFFDMLETIRSTQERAVFAEMLALLRERQPAQYQRNQIYYLDWQLVDAVGRGDRAALPALIEAQAACAGQSYTIIKNSLDRLAYYGHLAQAARMMALTQPNIGQGEELMPWVADRFGRHATLRALFTRIEQNPDLTVDTPGLLDEIAQFSEVLPERVAEHLALIGGRAEPRWQTDDFILRRHGQRGHKGQAKDQRSQLAQQTERLGLVFLGVLAREQGISLGKGDLARQALARYVYDRQSGDLKPAEPLFGQHKAKPQPAEPIHPLCPDRATFDRFLGDLLHMLEPNYYEAAATLELTPAWLRFIEGRGLISAEQRAATIADLRALVADCDPIWSRVMQEPAISAAIHRAWDLA